MKNHLIATEHDIQNAIHAYLSAYGWMVWRNNSGMIATTYKGRRHMIRMGHAGLPDLFAVKSGKLLGVEVKRPKKKPTIVQELMLQQLREHGAYTIIAHSVDEVARFIAINGL